MDSIQSLRRIFTALSLFLTTTPESFNGIRVNCLEEEEAGAEAEAEQEPEPIAVATSSTEVKDTQITEGLIITGTILALPLLIKAFFVNKLGAALLLGA